MLGSAQKELFYKGVKMLGTEEILENIVRLVSLLDDGVLHAVDELPILELAKWVVFPRPGPQT